MNHLKSARRNTKNHGLAGVSRDGLSGSTDFAVAKGRASGARRIFFLAVLVALAGFQCKKEIPAEKLQKQGQFYYEFGESEPFSGRTIAEYSPGKKQKVTNWEDGKMHGETRKWFPNGQLQSVENFEGGKRHGESVYYYKDGKKRAVFHYQNGRANGRYMAWHPNGKLKEEGKFLNQKRDGEFKTYDRQGNLKKTVMYQNGKPVP